MVMGGCNKNIPSEDGKNLVFLIEKPRRLKFSTKCKLNVSVLFKSLCIFPHIILFFPLGNSNLRAGAVFFIKIATPQLKFAKFEYRLTGFTVNKAKLQKKCCCLQANPKGILFSSC